MPDSSRENRGAGLYGRAKESPSEEGPSLGESDLCEETGRSKRVCNCLKCQPLTAETEIKARPGLIDPKSITVEASWAPRRERNAEYVSVTTIPRDATTVHLQGKWNYGTDLERLLKRCPRLRKIQLDASAYDVENDAARLRDRYSLDVELI